jgi:hypothetical protein
MLNRILVAAATLTMLTAAPAMADDDDWRGRGYYGDYGRDHGKYWKPRHRAYDSGYERGYREARRDYRHYDHYDDRRVARYAYREGYRDGHGYHGYRPVYYRSSRDYYGGWYGRNGRYYDDYRRCRKDSNIEGTLIGGIVGGVLGNEIARRGDKTIGTVIGAGIGAVIGHEIDDSSGGKRRYCY